MKKRIGWLALLAGVIALMMAVVPALAAPPSPDPWAQSPEYPGKVQREPDRQQGVRLSGTVVEVVERTIVLDIPLGQLDVQTDGRTHFVIPGVESPSIAGIEAGMNVAVQGRRLGRGFYAQAVLVLSENGGRVRGEVTAMGDGTFELATADGTVSVVVDARTRFRLPGIAEPSLADLTVGDRISVTGLHLDDGTFLARLVASVRPRIEERTGVVAAVDAESITVQLPRGSEVTAGVTGETVVFVPGVVDATIADIAVGDTVRVRAEVVGQDEFAALRIVVIPPDAAALMGTVHDVAGTTVQVETRMGQVIAVQTDAATQVIIPGVESPTLADLREGDKVRVGGSWVDAGDFYGWVIQVGREGRVGQTQGRILSLDRDAFVVGSPHGVVNVVVDEATRYRIPGVEEPGFDDLTAGQWVAVQGLFEADGVLRARLVTGRPQR